MPRRSLHRIPALSAALIVSLLALSGPEAAAASPSLGLPALNVGLRDSATQPSSAVATRRPPFADGPRVVEEVLPPPPAPPPPEPFSQRPTNNAIGVFIPIVRPGAYAPIPSAQAGHSDSTMLTFDDCASAEQIEGVVKALATIGKKGLFFITGQCRDHYPWLLEALKSGGHQVCNHTYSHPDLRRLSDAQVRSEIRAGVFAGCPYFRPPYGAWDGPRGRIAAIAAEFGLTPLLWDVDTRDWAGASAERIASTVRMRGGVVLMHLHGYFTADAVRLLG